jgi:hypothetical protein
MESPHPNNPPSTETANPPREHPRVEGTVNFHRLLSCVLRGDREDREEAESASKRFWRNHRNRAVDILAEHERDTTDALHLDSETTRAVLVALSAVASCRGRRIAASITNGGWIRVWDAAGGAEKLDEAPSRKRKRLGKAERALAKIARLDKKWQRLKEQSYDLKHEIKTRWSAFEDHAQWEGWQRDPTHVPQALGGVGDVRPVGGSSALDAV